MISNVLLVIGVGVLSAALRAFQNPAAFRIGTFGLVFTSFLAGWLIGGSLWVGAGFASTWFLLPWMEILTRVRRLRLPLDRRLESCAPPTRASFPTFEELSNEMESGGYEYVEDTGWSDEGSRQFFRLFRSGDRTTAGAICLVEQAEFSFYYVALRSRADDGRLLISWNYPFSYGLHQMPDTVVNRVAGDTSLTEMIARHREFLQEVGGGACRPVGETTLREEMEADLRGQLEHNLACGILKKEGEENIRYTLRGMVFLWFQFLRDFVRFS